MLQAWHQEKKNVETVSEISASRWMDVESCNAEGHEQGYDVAQQRKGRI